MGPRAATTKATTQPGPNDLPKCAWASLGPGRAEGEFQVNNGTSPSLAMDGVKPSGVGQGLHGSLEVKRIPYSKESEKGPSAWNVPEELRENLGGWNGKQVNAPVPLSLSLCIGLSFMPGTQKGGGSRSLGTDESRTRRHGWDERPGQLEHVRSHRSSPRP